MTLGEVIAHVKGFRKREEEKINLTIALAWNIGQFVGIGVNNPKGYPSWDEIEAKLKKAGQPAKAQTPEDMEQLCMAWAAG